jgi:hypothetical protein
MFCHTTALKAFLTFPGHIRRRITFQSGKDFVLNCLVLIPLEGNVHIVSSD